MNQNDFRLAIRRGLERFRPGFIEPSRLDSFINDVKQEYLEKVSAHQNVSSGKEILRVIFTTVAARAFNINPVYDAGRAIHVAEILLEEMAAVVA